jgi:hypothetical protein
VHTFGSRPKAGLSYRPPSRAHQTTYSCQRSADDLTAKVADLDVAKDSSRGPRVTLIPMWLRGGREVRLFEASETVTFTVQPGNPRSKTLFVCALSISLAIRHPDRYVIEAPNCQGCLSIINCVRLYSRDQVPSSAFPMSPFAFSLRSIPSASSLPRGLIFPHVLRRIRSILASSKLCSVVTRRSKSSN